MTERADVVVIGAGAMGSAAAYWLARDGRDVVLLEQFERGHDRGSSHGGTRIFRYGYPDPMYVEMVKAALPLWREIEAEAGIVLVERTGAVDHGEDASIAEVADAMKVAGVDVERLSPGEAEARWPGMRFDTTVLFHPDGGRCLADRAVRTLQERAEAHGAIVHFGLGQARVHPSDDHVVVRAGGTEWRAPVAVVTAGGWVGSVVNGPDADGARDPGTGPALRSAPGVDERGGRASSTGGDRGTTGCRRRTRGSRSRSISPAVEVDPDDRPARDDRLERDIVDYVDALAARPRPDARPPGDLPLHEHGGRGLHHRSGRPAGGRIDVLGPRVQVHAADRPAPGRSGRGRGRAGGDGRGSGWVSVGLRPTPIDVRRASARSAVLQRSLRSRVSR